MNISKGLRYKPKWRYVGNRFHLFLKRSRAGAAAVSSGLRGYVHVSACGREVLVRTGGQACDRPEVALRCGVCDGFECLLYGVEESRPPSKTGRERKREREVRRLRRRLREAASRASAGADAGRDRTMADDAFDEAVAVCEEFGEEP